MPKMPKLYSELSARRQRNIRKINLDKNLKKYALNIHATISKTSNLNSQIISSVSSSSPLSAVHPFDDIILEDSIVSLNEEEKKELLSDDSSSTNSCCLNNGNDSLSDPLDSEIHPNMKFNDTAEFQNYVANMLISMQLEIRELRDLIKAGNQHREEEQDPLRQKIEGQFPCQNLEALQAIENWLKTSKKHKKIMYDIFKNVGGNGSRDFVLRLLKKTLSNSLAELCSWTGAKHNFKLHRMEFIQIMFYAVRDSTSVTERDFEIAVKEWLRHAHQRRLREERK